MISVIVPSFHDETLEKLFRSMEQSERNSLRDVIVLDNGLSSKFWKKWPDVANVPVSSPFVAARAINIGIRWSYDQDVVMIHDDARIESEAWLQHLEAQFDHWPSGYGLLTLQQTTTKSIYGIAPGPLMPIELQDVAFGSGLLMPRRVIDTIGLWDESLIGYGFDDFDYGVRALHAGLKLGVSGAVMLQNAAQAAGWVRRLGSYEAVLKQQDVNFDIFHKKWFGVIPADLTVCRPLVSEHLNRKACHCAAI